MDYDALDKLVQLRDSGAITDEEFSRLKQDVLNDASSQEGPGEIIQNIEGRFSSYLNRAESIYLRVLRASTLIIASIFVVFAAWLVVSGIYNISRDASSVQEMPAEVTPEEIAQIDLGQTSDTGIDAEKRDPLAGERKFYKDFSAKYLALFRKNFESYRQASDKPLTPDAFDDKFLHVDARLAGIEDESLDFEQDRADLEKLFSVMSEAASLPATKERLALYKKTPRNRVENKVKKTRNERYCAYYGYYIGECIVWDTRKVSYTDTEVTMELPKGVIGYLETFGAYQDNFMRLITSRREKNQRDAEDKRQEILVANEEGKQGLWTALQVAGGFLALMFFFLLIAIERHQRQIAARTEA